MLFKTILRTSKIKKSTQVSATEYNRTTKNIQTECLAPASCFLFFSLSITELITCWTMAGRAGARDRDTSGCSNHCCWVGCGTSRKIRKACLASVCFACCFRNKPVLGGGSKYFLFSPLFGEDSQFDSYFSKGLKPPTRACYSFVIV